MDAINYQTEIEICRENFGAPGQREFSFFDKLFYLNVRKPLWCGKKDDLYTFFGKKWEIFQSGIVVWAHLVQANLLLFKPGHDNCPASAVFCPDENAETNIEHLRRVAKQLYELKGTTPQDPKLREIAEMLTDEMIRTSGNQIPEEISGVTPIFESTVFVTRKHLPNPRYLKQSFFPLVVSPNPPFYNFPLPARFWSERLIENW